MGDTGEPVESRWYLIVNGSSEHRRIIEELELHGIEMVADSGMWLLYISELQENEFVASPQERYRAGQKILQAINGMTSDEIPFPEPLESDAIGKINAEGKREFFSFQSESLQLSSQVKVAITDEEGERQEFDHIELMTPRAPYAIATPERRRALRLLGDEPGFRELYVVLEDALDSLGGRDGIEEAGIEWTEIQRFKQTANSLDAVGDDTRHGAAKTAPPPEDPMGIHEARNLIIELVNWWLRQELG